MGDRPVIVVGAGLAGLTAALELQAKGIPCRVLESSDGVGGRVRTDEFEGFRLDRGFQVFLTAYPEGLRLLDYPALDFRRFGAGAYVRVSGSFHKIVDPWRHSNEFLTAVFSPVGSLGDKLKLQSLRRRLMNTTIENILEGPAHTTLGLLRQEGFGRLIDRFFRPFLGGIMLDTALNPSSRMFEFVFKMMAEGDTAVPAKGMGEIPRQLAAGLKPDTIRLDVRVESVEAQAVRLATGETIPAEAVILAADGVEAARLTQRTPPRWRGVACLYFAAPEPPVEGPWLILNGNNQWPVNNIAVMSEVSAEYAPAGQSLISVTVIGKPSQTDEELQYAVYAQLDRWYGRSARQWRHLRTYRIPFAQPETVPTVPSAEGSRIRPGLYLAGDFQVMPSAHFAMLAGRLAAEAAVADLTGQPLEAAGAGGPKRSSAA